MTTRTILYRYSCEPTSAQTVPKKLLHDIVKLLFFWIPKGSPGYDKVFNKIRYWYIEVDNENNSAQREIGFDESGNAIVYAPNERDYGFWTDSDKKFALNEGEIINNNEFKRKWDSISRSQIKG